MTRHSDQSRVSLSRSDWFGLGGFALSIVVALVAAAWQVHLSTLATRERMAALETQVESLKERFEGFNDDIRALRDR